MHYIIDGYNLFFRLENQVLPLSDKRKEFMESLNDEITIYRLNVTLIFDSGKTHSEIFPSKKMLEGLDVVFSPQGMSADEYILEFLDYQQEPQNEVIVTSDRDLTKKASYLGAKTQTIEAFLKMLLHKKKGLLPPEETKQLRESDTQIARLLEIFEDKLRNETPD